MFRYPLPLAILTRPVSLLALAGALAACGAPAYERAARHDLARQSVLRLLTAQLLAVAVSFFVGAAWLARSGGGPAPAGGRRDRQKARATERATP
ncbi:MAG: hypothetical protein JOZ69_15755 [Myxococcales bacterium]|nr:hypothetical protein [Myxococcales bacterium]